jgi:hypothetical protein
MASIQWRPEVNALTVPQSYKMRYLPQKTVGSEELAAEIAAEVPGVTPEQMQLALQVMARRIQQNLIAGNQVTLEDAFTYTLALTGKLEDPDSPLPPIDEVLQVRIYASLPFVKEIRHAAHLERLALVEKLPVLASVKDSLLKLDEVLQAQSVLKITGSNLMFNQEDAECGCVIEGTRSGRTVQTKYVQTSQAEILLLPDIPSQEEAWNNEYTLVFSTRYSEHGTLRTSTYKRKLRSPLVALISPATSVGILTGNAAEPYVVIMDGEVSANERVRIQAVVDIRDTSRLLFNLLDMQEGCKAGLEVIVTENGLYTLHGFTDSAVSNLEIKVMSFDQLMNLTRNGYAGRLVDILDVRIA